MASNKSKSSYSNLADHYAQQLAKKMELQLNPPIIVEGVVPPAIKILGSTISFTTYTPPDEPLDLRYNAIESFDDVISLISQDKKRGNDRNTIALTPTQLDDLERVSHKPLQTILGYDVIIKEQD